MKKGYWIVRVDVTDPEKFKRYAAKTPDVLKEFGGLFLVRAGNSRLVEGSTRARNTIVEFPSYQAAMACWESAEYQAVKELRLGGGEVDIVIIEGCID